MKAAIILTLILTACSSGDAVVSDQADTATKVPPADGVRCGDADLTNAPAGWCSNPNDVIHMGKPNS